MSLTIQAKKFKDGELKGQVYFIENKSNNVYLLNVAKRTVSHKVVNGKKVDLNFDDQLIIEVYDLEVEDQDEIKESVEVEDQDEIKESDDSISCKVKDQNSWTLLYERSHEQYTGEITIDALGSTSLLGMYIKKRPDQIEKIFSRNHYKQCDVEGGIIISCRVESIDESFDVLLKKIPCDEGEREKKIQNDRILGLEKKIRILEEQIKTRDEIVEKISGSMVDSTIECQTFYPNSTFNIPPESLIAFAKEYSHDYIEFRRQQVNSTETETMDKYKLNLDKLSDLKFLYMARVNNMSFHIPVVNYHTDWTLTNGTFIMRRGCWVAKKEPIESLTSNKDVIYVHNTCYGVQHNPYAPFIITRESRTPLSSAEKQRLKLE
ncbi:MAG: hypothetical protein PHG66_00130 [Candidatus Colwellbacteria bacterium]|nr:hypothetical protein [Candidatus Colwellbacteria bacterium]